MSIHPTYAEAILRGEKQVEFRKRPVADDVTHVVVYATLPVGAIIGAFTVAGQETSSLHSLWQAFGEVAGIRHNEFAEYYRSHNEGTCIRVGDIFLASERVDLSIAFGISRPPQSFQYVDTGCAKDLLDGMQPIRRSVLTLTLAPELSCCSTRTLSRAHQPLSPM